jgi:DNA polymerase-3 subunit delta
MKLTWKQIEPFVKNPDPKARVVLVYGPDNGLMRERAKLICKTIVSDINDPFNVIALTSDQVNEDPARLSDEAKAFSMMGGSRLIRIENGADKLTPVIKEYLTDPSAENLVIIEAGELTTRSSLRKLCESAKNAAALPCYVEDERGVSQVIRQSLQDENLMINMDALNWLAANIAGDRGRVRGEISKLITYMGSDKKKATMADVQACCGEAGAGSLENLIYAIAGGQPQTAMTAYQQLLSEGVPVIVMLRSIQMHFKKLHYTQALMSEGKGLEQAMKSLQPPIFFKQESAFKAQVSKWSMLKINRVLDRLNDLEAQTKQTGTPVETLCSQAFISLSSIR